MTVGCVIVFKTCDLMWRSASTAANISVIALGKRAGESVEAKIYLAGAEDYMSA